MSTITVTGLPPRESKALELTAGGMTTKAAARAMGCSPRNVEALIHVSMERLGASNRTHLITRAVEQGFLRVGVSVLVVSSALSLMPSQTVADEDHASFCRTRRTQTRNVAVPLSDDLDCVDLSRPHSLVWDDGLFIAYQ